MLVPGPLIWIVVGGFIVAFILGFGSGANDVANMFGTSVGSNVLSLRCAFILATVFETTGAVLLGGTVSETIRSDIINPNVYINQTELHMISQLSAIAGSGIWMLIATFFKMPVSTTHGIVGAVIGSTLVVKGSQSINMRTVLFIASSWILSPVFGGLMSTILFLFCRKFILSKSDVDPIGPGMTFVPVFYGMIIMVNLLSVLIHGPPYLYMSKLPIWAVFGMSFAMGLVGGILVRIFLVPWQSNKIREMASAASTENCYTELQSSDQSQPESKPACDLADHPQTSQIFANLQILTAVCVAFAHGGNDVSNSVGPLISIWFGATSTSQTSPTPIWMLLYGGISMSVGLWIWGSRVIETIGTHLTSITPSSGFCIELGSAFSVLVASKLGMPISSTHCIVGSVVFVGRVRSRENVDWSLFRNILMAWLLTLPVAGALSALLMLLLQHIILTRNVALGSNLLNSTDVSVFNSTPTASYSY